MGCEWPVMQTCMPPSCPPLPWVIERTRQKRLAMLANRGSISPSRTPGTAVAIGLYGPRMPSGALGLGSNESMCEQPPYCTMKMQDNSDGFRAPACSSRGKLKPSRPRPPTSQQNLAPREGRVMSESCHTSLREGHSSRGSTCACQANRDRIGWPELAGRVKPSAPRRVSGATPRAW